MVANVDALAMADPRGERFLGRLRDRLVAGDPALSRLRLSSRALLSLLLSLGLLAGFAFKVTMLPIGAFGLAVVIAFVGSMAITDKGARAQLVTRGYGLLAAVVPMVVAGLLAPMPFVAFPLFLVVIFGAAYLRKYGPRGFAIGMIAFMGYFMGDYLRPALGDSGAILFAAIVSFAVTQLVTTVILPDDAERDFRRALLTIDRRLNLLLRALLESAESGQRPDMKLMLRHIDRLRDIVLMAEGFIPQGEIGSLAAAGAASELAVALFELQLVAERLVVVASSSPGSAEALRAVLFRDRHATGPVLAAAGQGDTAAVDRLLVRLERARRQVEATLGPRPSPAFVLRVRTTPPAAAAGTPDRRRRFGVPPDLQLPIQITLACGIALSIGLTLSPVRWYWAVIASFIVFNNARSRADTALRALQRSAGTFAGLIGGTVIATLLQGEPVVAGIGVPVMFFIAFYFVQTSYSTMIFFVTVALALLYGVMGMFTPQLLLLRLAETVVGALAGTAVAFFVFPTRASAMAGAALDKYLKALTELVAAAGRRAHGEPEPQHLLARSRLLDRAYTELATTVRPLGGPWSFVTRFGEVRERLLLLAACAHWGRVLARGLKAGMAPDAGMVARIDALAVELGTRIDAAEAVREHYFERPKPVDMPVVAPRPPLAINEDDDPLLALEIMSVLLARATSAPRAAGTLPAG